MKNSPEESPKFPVEARIALIFSIVLILISTVQLIYRYYLPTEGWLLFTTDTFEHPDWLFHENLVDTSSDMQLDDVIIGVNSVSIQGRATDAWVQPPPEWQKGAVVNFEVVRAGEHLSIHAPIVQWTGSAILKNLWIQPEIAVGFVSSLIMLVLGTYTVLQQPETPAARSLLVFTAIFFAMSISNLVPIGISVQFDSSAFFASAFFSFLIFPILLAPSILNFTILFPQPNPLMIRYPFISKLPYMIGASVGVLLLFPAIPTQIGWFATMGMIILSLVSLLHSVFSIKDRLSETQLRLAISGLILGLSLMLLVFPAASEWVADAIIAQLLGAGFYVGFAIITISFSIAILRFHLFEIDLFIHNALVYSLLSGMSIGIYFLVVSYLGFLFRAEGENWQALIATGVVALVFAPLHTKLRSLVSRFVYGDRDQPYIALTNLGLHLEMTADLSSSLALAVESIAKSLKVPYVGLQLFGNDNVQNTIEYGPFQNETSSFPLMHRGEPVGNLMIASRNPKEPLTTPDKRLLTDLARQLSATAKAAILATDLDAARLRLVREETETRRTLGRDIHDGIGHRLVALARSIENPATMFNGTPEEISELLNKIHVEVLQITKQVRDIAHQLYPPELELLGLVDALRERTQDDQALVVKVDSPQELKPFLSNTPEEATLYFIALEALTNVKKHSKATLCMIEFKIENTNPAKIIMLITDNGQGFQHEKTTGMGLLTMKARAADVGGRTQIQTKLGSGTSITVTIPLSNNPK
ncbi:MAG: hypothetical protein DWQ07_17075 [Chloroflexi bacterium]|nr:MAG: hypothetical protein DWQ07_17075 [Chloroflexota bacterium]MBL1195118.1 hypothetical protein [Chloroflexota bacterium]NOH12403.1 hypothetical protein [Chloroflexota bacterium]